METKQKLLGTLAVVAIIGFKVAVKLGLGVGVTEMQIAESKNEAWPKEFKDAMITGCADPTTEIAKEYGEAATTKYCSCFANSLEQAHVIPTLYNTVTDSEDGYVNKVDGIISTYISSEPGQKASQDCMALAAMGPPASGESEGRVPASNEP